MTHKAHAANVLEIYNFFYEISHKICTLKESNIYDVVKSLDPLKYIMGAIFYCQDHYIHKNDKLPIWTKLFSSQAQDT